MKRSEINAVIRKFEALLDKYSFALPPFLSWTPEEWQTKGHEYDEVRDCMLGWDITDYGQGDFDHFGFRLSRSATEIVPCRTSIRRSMPKSCYT